jgi:probable HAF family extracellular repeat protein
MRHSLFALLLSSSLAAPLAAYSQPLYNMRFLPPNTTPHAIDAAGRIVGVATDGRGFLWSRGVMTSLGTLGGNGSVATAIGPDTQVTGSADTKKGVSHAFVYKGGALAWPSMRAARWPGTRWTARATTAPSCIPAAG